MPKPLKLSQQKQLLVEGRDAEAFFYPFIESMGLKNDIQIHNYGSVSELDGFLKQFVRNSQYRSLPVTSIGIIRDAEISASSALQSVQGSLEKAELPVPLAVSTPTEGKPQVNIFILPDGQQAGMIEALLLSAVEREPGFECVDKYLACVVESTGIEPKPKDKARFLTFLASRPDIKPLTGFAARAGYLNFDSPVYDPLKQFLHTI